MAFKSLFVKRIKVDLLFCLMFNASMSKEDQIQNWGVVMVPKEQVQGIVSRATEKAERRIAEIGFSIDQGNSPAPLNDMRNEN